MINEQNEQKEQPAFFCECCVYKCSKKSNFNRHLETAKHKKLENTMNSNKNEPETETEIVEIYTNNFSCPCGKVYKHTSSLWTHKKTCVFIDETQIVNITPDIVATEKTDVSGSGDYKDIIMTLVNENKEMRNMMMEQQKTIGELIPIVGNNNNNTNNNTINQKFNINVFLNEQCKGAINMSDFIKSIEVSLEQLDFTKTNGLEKGISNVIMENMNKLSLYERPIHCTDAKRETIYIKDNNIWEKDTDKSKIKQAIKKTSNKNYVALTNWTKANPNFMKDDNKQMFYAKAISSVGKPIDGVDDKIVKNLCNSTKLKEIKD